MPKKFDEERLFSELAELDLKRPKSEIAKSLKVSRPTLIKYLEKWEDEGRLFTVQSRGRQVGEIVLVDVKKPDLMSKKTNLMSKKTRFDVKKEPFDVKKRGSRKSPNSGFLHQKSVFLHQKRNTSEGLSVSSSWHESCNLSPRQESKDSFLVESERSSESRSFSNSKSSRAGEHENSPAPDVSETSAHTGLSSSRHADQPLSSTTAAPQEKGQPESSDGPQSQANFLVSGETEDEVFCAPESDDRRYKLHGGTKVTATYIYYNVLSLSDEDVRCLLNARRWKKPLIDGTANLIFRSYKEGWARAHRCSPSHYKPRRPHRIRVSFKDAAKLYLEQKLERGWSPQEWLAAAEDLTPKNVKYPTPQMLGGWLGDKVQSYVPKDKRVDHHKVKRIRNAEIPWNDSSGVEWYFVDGGWAPSLHSLSEKQNKLFDKGDLKPSSFPPGWE